MYLENKLTLLFVAKTISEFTTYSNTSHVQLWPSTRNVNKCKPWDCELKHYFTRRNNKKTWKVFEKWTLYLNKDMYHLVPIPAEYEIVSTLLFVYFGARKIYVVLHHVSWFKFLRKYHPRRSESHQICTSYNSRL